MSLTEQNVKRLQEADEDKQDVLESILKSVQEIEKRMARDRGFFAGIAFAYSSIAFLVGAGMDYLFHRITS